MTIEELKLTNAVDTLIKEAENERESYDPQDADYDRCDKCHQSSYVSDYMKDDYFVDGKVEAYKEILKLLHKQEDNFNEYRAMKIIGIRSECIKIVQNELLKFCKEEKIELPTYYAY